MIALQLTYGVHCAQHGGALSQAASAEAVKQYAYGAHSVDIMEQLTGSGDGDGLRAVRRMAMSLTFTPSRLARAVRNCTWNMEKGGGMVKVAETRSAIPAGGVGGGEGGGGLGGGDGGGSGGGDGGGKGGGDGGGEGGGGEGGGGEGASNTCDVVPTPLTEVMATPRLAESSVALPWSADIDVWAKSSKGTMMET